MNMQKHCFSHLTGFDDELERQLHNANILCYEQLEEYFNSQAVYFKYKAKNLRQIKESKEAIETKNWDYFTSKLNSCDHYKLLWLSKNIAFVDIETTGLSKNFHDITTIGIYDLHSSRVYVNGIDLEEAFEDLKKFDIIVTFNGKQFDIPFIEHKSNETYECVHLDLRFMLKEFGLSGGLKRIEKELHISRDEDVEHIDGFEAIRLWRKYQGGDNDALELLIKYNIEDIENLEVLLNWYLDRKR